MYLIDTNVISELRKATKACTGVRAFFARAAIADERVYLSSVTVGELRRGVNLIRHRGDLAQAASLEAWLALVLARFQDDILPFDTAAAQVWGRLSVPDPSHLLDKQIAAIALVNGLTVVTRNSSDFAKLGVPVENPF